MTNHRDIYIKCIKFMLFFLFPEHICMWGMSAVASAVFSLSFGETIHYGEITKQLHTNV